MKLITKHCLILATSASLFSSFEATAQLNTAPLVGAVDIAIERNDSDVVSMPMTRGAIEGRQFVLDFTGPTQAWRRASENFVLLRDDFEGETVLQIQQQGQRIYDRYIATAPSLAVSYQAAFNTKAAVRFQHKLAALTQAYYNVEASTLFTRVEIYGPVPAFNTAAWTARAQTYFNFATVGIRSSFPYLNSADALENGPGGWATSGANLSLPPIGRAAQFARLYDNTGR